MKEIKKRRGKRRENDQVMVKGFQGSIRCEGYPPRFLYSRGFRCISISRGAGKAGLAI